MEMLWIIMLNFQVMLLLLPIKAAISVAWTGYSMLRERDLSLHISSKRMPFCPREDQEMVKPIGL